MPEWSFLVLDRATDRTPVAGYLLSGRMTMTIGEQEHQFGPGDSWCIASGVEHGAVIHETCLAIEVFSPAREDYMPYLPAGK